MSNELTMTSQLNEIRRLALDVAQAHDRQTAARVRYQRALVKLGTVAGIDLDDLSEKLLRTTVLEIVRRFGASDSDRVRAAGRIIQSGWSLRVGIGLEEEGDLFR